MTTIADVARHASVGVGTVSRVLNDHPSVRPQTRRRVRDAMAELDYRPSPLARNLKRGRTQRIGVLVSFFTHPSAVERLHGLAATLSSSGYELVLYPVDGDEQRAAHMDSLAGPHQADGLLLMSLPPTDAEVERLERFAVSVVQVDAHHPAFTRVVTDDIEGGRLATEHLLELGHRDIAFLGDPEDNPYGFTSSRDRCHGYRSALQEAGVTPDPDWILTAPHGLEAARAATAELLDRGHPRPTAIFAASDTQALGALQAARTAGVRVPDDLSVLGFDDIETAVHAGLSTIRQPLEDSGRLGAQLLLDHLADPEREVEEVFMPLQVVDRATTAPPP